MTTDNHVREILNELIQINNDRIEGYRMAIKEAGNNDAEVEVVFHRMEDQSIQNISALTAEVLKTGGEPVSGTTTSGKLHRVWMDLQSKFSDNADEKVLSNCASGEDAALKAYNEALSPEATLPADIRLLLENQKAALSISHDTIKRLIDRYRNNKVPEHTGPLQDAPDESGPGATGSNEVTGMDALSGSQSGPPHIS